MFAFVLMRIQAESPINRTKTLLDAELTYANALQRYEMLILRH